MKIVIVGAGKVGKAIARDLISSGHEVVIIDQNTKVTRPLSVEHAIAVEGDACEVDVLEAAKVAEAEVLVATTGDDKVNLVISLLAKTEFSVPRVVARVNHPKNEWLFNESWGVDVAVSTPRMLTALIEEAFSVGELVKLFSFRESQTDLVEMTLSPTSKAIGTRVGDLVFPPDTALVAILRSKQVITPSKDDALEAGDELVFVARAAEEEELARILT
jgi:trk system potassium uptake protein TrkA